MLRAETARDRSPGESGVDPQANEFNEPSIDPGSQEGFLDELDPVSRYEAISSNHRDLLRNPGEVGDFPERLSEAADDLCTLVETDLDVALFQTVRRDPAGDAAVHSFGVALICGAVSKRLGLNRDEARRLVSAAMTMNIAMIDLQRLLWSQATPLTHQQREEIRLHPQRGRGWLEALGVSDADWLRAVEEHHESPDGTGYPKGIREPSALAQTIRHTDVYCAMLGSRAYRAPLPANQAARRLYMLSDRRQDSLPALIIEEVGIFPPGNYVRLANGETGIVLHRGDAANTPRVVALTDGHGDPLPDQPIRDTAIARFSIAELLPYEELKTPLNARALFDCANVGPMP
jgi:hypothetical protein